MALTLVLGPANSAKAGEVLGAYSAAARRGALLVVPTATDARHYAAELAGQGVVLGTVLTFAGLGGEIARRVDYGGRRLSDLQRRRVLERVLRKARLEVFAESAAGPGFAAAAEDLIAELQRALIGPERLRGALRRWAAEDVRRAPFARELGRLYAEYIAELDRIGWVDGDLYAWRALDALRAAPETWGQTGVFFYGFDDLTALERDAVETLARVVGVDVTVSLTYEPGREALAARAETVEELRPLAERVVELPALDDHYAPGSRAVLHHLERSLFTAEPDRLDPGDAIVLMEAGGERAEAELIAREAAQLVADGVAPEDIVVVCRHRDRTAPVLADVFRQYGIPLAGAGAPPIGHTPLGAGLVAAGRCACAVDPPATADELLTYLRTPGVAETPDIVDELEVSVRRRALRTAAEARRELGRPLPELDALAAAPDPGAELCRLARWLFSAPHRHRADALSAAEELDARALRAVLAAVDELAELGLVPPADELVGLLQTLPVAPSAAVGGGVLVAEPQEVRARRFRVVFVCGIQEGEFPRPATPEPFLPDERRWELALSSGLRLRPREDALAAERYLFYAAVSRATDRVFLAYRSSDEEGNLALPSPFVGDVASVLAADWPARRRRRLLADVVWDPAAAPSDRERRRALAAAGAAAAGEAPAPERVLGASAIAGIRHSEILSAGALEAYASCPMRWLIERELQPRPLTPDSEAMVRGTLMHEVLERLLRELGGPVTADSLVEAEGILERILDGLAERAADGLAPGDPAVVRAAALRSLEADLRRYLEHEAAFGSAWRPLGLEMRFGFDEEDSLPPLQLEAGGERVLVRGLIDRVDTDGRGHAIVRDYKSGGRRQEWAAARWSEDRQLQVALYMLVVRELVGAEPVAGLYQPLRGDDLRARGVFVSETPVGDAVYGTDARAPDEVEAMLADAAERAVALGVALRGGVLTPCPQTCSRDGCAYPGICRSQ